MKKIVSMVVILIIMASVSTVLAADKQENEAEAQIAALTKAIAGHPQDVQNYVNRGKIYASRNQTALALADYNRAITLDPNNLLAYTARAQAFGTAKQYEAALADYSKVIEISPGDINARFQSGVCHYYRGEYELGIGDLEQVIVMQPAHAGAYLVKAVCLQKLERNDEAVAAYKSLLINVPEGKESQEAIGMAKKMLKRLGAEL
ncbi:MAG TPA: tetratricopeptide repeat protein [Patescibacteria group bacterium]|nr:tetratricopeptide repeat protein [Patescibacteria group bacterium]